MLPVEIFQWKEYLTEIQHNRAHFSKDFPIKTWHRFFINVFNRELSKKK